MKIIIHIALIILISTSFSSPSWGFEKKNQFIVLCYHSILPNPIQGDTYGLSHKRFVEQMEYLYTHGYNPISLADIINAQAGRSTLPPKAILLTFDDAYRSYKEFVVPVLEWFGYPSVLSVVGKWIDTPPPGLPEPLLSWKDLKELSQKEKIAIVSHSYDLHKAIQYNPIGNVGAAVSVLAFNSNSRAYESEPDYRQRLLKDFKTQNNLFYEKLNFLPNVITWPYGRFNAISIEMANQNGLEYSLTLEEGINDIDQLKSIKRLLIKNADITHFIDLLNNPDGHNPHIRSVQVDLDLIYDPNSLEQTDKNLGLLIDRLVAMKINTVYLQAFSDADGDGNVESVYFHNRILPVRADIFSHAAHQMAIRDIQVYGWMPVLAFTLPDKTLTERLRVKHMDDDNHLQISYNGYHRLSPFSSEVEEIIGTLYEDLAAHSQIHGVLFQDDAYLSDREDFHLSAATFNRQYLGNHITQQQLLAASPETDRWSHEKSIRLVSFTQKLMQRVKKYRPAATFARNIYAGAILNPEAERWFSQNYRLFLDSYDQVVIMAYPFMEKADRPMRWLQKLVRKTMPFDSAQQKTVFKLQTFDWNKNDWVATDDLVDQVREILSVGGRHIAYYPDNVWEDQPILNSIKLEMSTETFPYERDQ